MKTLLLVEDSEDDIFFMERALERRKADCSLHITRNGQEAVYYLSGAGAYANRHAHPFPDVVVTDVKMPIMTGHELLEWIRNQKLLRRLPVLMLTSSMQDQDIDRAYEQGANSYLVKPTTTAQLDELISLAARYWLEANTPPQLASN